MLMAILILLLVSGIVAAGVPVARDAYEKVVIGANAKVLLSTAISSLRDEIATARNVKVESNAIEYFSTDKGATCRITPLEKSIQVEDYIDSEYSAFHKDEEYKNLTHSLISQKTATGDLYVTYDSATRTANTVVINNLRVCRESNPDTPMAQVSTLEIRVIKAISTEAP